MQLRKNENEEAQDSKELDLQNKTTFLFKESTDFKEEKEPLRDKEALVKERSELTLRQDDKETKTKDPEEISKAEKDTKTDITKAQETSSPTENKTPTDTKTPFETKIYTGINAIPEIKKSKEPNIDWSAQLKGATAASIATIPWHPLELLNKRWMVAKVPVNEAFKDPVKLNKALFQDAYEKGILEKIGSTRHGLKMNVANRALQWIYLNSAQHEINKQLEASKIGDLSKKISPNYNGVITQTAAGAIAGAGECIMMPFEVLKIQLMSNPEVRDTIRKEGPLSYIWKQGITNLYKATSLTVAKNTLGSGLYFGVDAAAKQALGIKNAQDATPGQIYLASTLGTLASQTGTNPLDVLKTRTQALPGSTKVRDVLRDTLQKENLSAFSRGLFSKFAIKGTKQAFMFGTAEILANKFRNHPDQLTTSSRPGMFQIPYKAPESKQDDITQISMMPPP